MVTNFVWKVVETLCLAGFGGKIVLQIGQRLRGLSSILPRTHDALGWFDVLCSSILLIFRLSLIILSVLYFCSFWKSIFMLTYYTAKTKLVFFYIQTWKYHGEIVWKTINFYLIWVVIFSLLHYFIEFFHHLLSFLSWGLLMTH